MREKNERGASHLYAEHTAWPRSEMGTSGKARQVHIKITHRKASFPVSYFYVHPSFHSSHFPRIGAICQIRTDDLLITSELLYQLS